MDTSGVSPTLSANGGGQGAKTGLYAVSCVNKGEKVRQNGRRIKRNEEPSFTLNTIDRQGILKDSRIRRLTPIECMRLQGFPDHWCNIGINEKGEEVLISDSQIYKMAGNAVSCPVVREVIKRLL